jgi:P-type Ca2+ transporter type 2C
MGAGGPRTKDGSRRDEARRVPPLPVGGIAPPPVPWSAATDAVCTALGVDPCRGLSAAEAARRLRIGGPNRLREAARRGVGSILVAQLRSLVVLLLALAGVLALALGERLEALAIGIVLALNTAIGFVAEWRGQRSMEGLRRLGETRARVRRDGEEQLLATAQLVPGDLVQLEEGDLVAADLRLVEANRLEADESTLTGESVPVAKDIESVPAETPLAERRSMLYRGTAVTRGNGRAVVVATAMATEVGRLAALAESAAAEEVTPLEARLERLGQRLIWWTLGVAAATVAIGLAAGRDAYLMVETGIALAVAAVPEGLPIVATLALARGMWRMARRNALVRRLAAVETLGSTTVILTDKTGTLTENRLTAVRLEVASGTVHVEGEGLARRGRFLRPGAAVDAAADEELHELLLTAALCNNAALGAGEAEAVGDPLEVALLVVAAKAGLDRQRLLAEWPEVREEAFDRATQQMATVHGRDAELRVAVKGAPEAVLAAAMRERRGAEEVPLDAAARERWQARNHDMAAAGLRVLGVAARTATDAGEPVFTDLVFLGLVGLLDPPRHDIRATLAACREAGIRVVMATGDQAPTAVAVARAVGLVEEGAEPEVVAGRDLPAAGALDDAGRARLLRVPIFARVDPAQKLELLALHQQAGEIVAVTGDGVNDAPALERADIGIAMGQRGTQVAQDAADMVLRDDRFSTLVEAIAQGRILYGNIRRFVVYLLSCNASEILVVAGAMPFTTQLPLLPMQILFLNLVTDVFPALALALGEGERDVMRQPPRDPREPVLTGAHWRAIAGFGLLLTAAVLGAYFTASALCGWATERAVTISFLTLALAQLVHVVNLRTRAATLFSNQIVRNRWMLGALALCLGLLAAAVYLPGLAAALGVVDPGRRGWALAAGFALLPALAGRLVIGRRRSVRRTDAG